MPRLSLSQLTAEIVACRACPRLVQWREQVAEVKRAAFRNEEYWGRPIPGFGDSKARLLICGLAPAAHGGNRTGRVFTGDRSGDFLFAALHRAGFANQPASRSRDDGLRLGGCYISACVRCCPPDNRPINDERERCLPFLERELSLLTDVRCAVCLGAFAWDGMLRTLAKSAPPPRPRPRFGHGVVAALAPFALLGCYHPSQQNTFTGRLTEKMLDAIFLQARGIVELSR